VIVQNNRGDSSSVSNTQRLLHKNVKILWAIPML